MIDHVGFEVSDLQRSTRFYDPIFHALGARRTHDAAQAVAYGITGPYCGRWPGGPGGVVSRPPCARPAA
jgi:catechol 2,3-dioxygenase-like lactoylglutathione lyase family enzyme